MQFPSLLARWLLRIFATDVWNLLLTHVISSWNDRIPFVLLFSIATSIELFQSKLPRETVRRLSGSSFHVKQIDVQQIFQIIHHEESALFFGSGLSSQILEQNRDFIQSFSAFAGTLRVT